MFVDYGKDLNDDPETLIGWISPDASPLGGYVYFEETSDPVNKYTDFVPKPGPVAVPSNRGDGVGKEGWAGGGQLVTQFLEGPLSALSKPICVTKRLFHVISCYFTAFSRPREEICKIETPLHLQSSNPTIAVKLFVLLSDDIVHFR